MIDKIKVTTVLVTGGAGFIGYYVSKRLLEMNCKVIGLDNLNDYYDVSLKKYRIRLLQEFPQYMFVLGNLADAEVVYSVFDTNQLDTVIHLGAQAGVRYSIENPRAYLDSNIVGFFNVMDACRKNCENIKHLVFASSSSVYGTNEKTPYSVEDRVDTPISFYAATKKCDELMAHAYSRIYGLPCTGLRFFTVYGPMGRPDMAYFKFANKLVNGEKIQVYNNGDMYRDFTYIDDVIEGIIKVLYCPPELNENGARYKIYNIGNNKPQQLMDFVHILERSLSQHGISMKQPQYEFLPMQLGDVYQTYADVDELIKDFAYSPSTPLEKGIDLFAAWYADYYLKEKNDD